MRAQRIHQKTADIQTWAGNDLTVYDEPCQHWALVVLYSDERTDGQSFKNVLTGCIQKIINSPTGGALLNEAMRDGWSVGLSELSNRDFHLDVPEKKLTLDNNMLSAGSIQSSDYFCNVVLLNLIRALRDIWQEKRHGAFDELYGPEAVLMLERVRVADCETLATLIAWELRSEGHHDLWRHLIGSEEGDIALAFSNYLERNPASLYNGKAMAVAFKQWYADVDRVNICDHDTLEYLDEILQSETYHDPFGGKRLTPVGLEVLSCMPDKTAYLQGSGEEILHNPDFAGLFDPINQSHFFHIMYDRQVVMVNNVPFRDRDLARKIFPQ